LGAAADGDRVVGGERLVEPRDLGTQERRAERLGVAQGEAVPEGAHLVVRVREQLSHGEPLDVGGAQQIGHGELVHREVAFDLERRQRRHERRRSSLRRILPEIVLGRDSTNSISRGYLYGAVTVLTWSCSSRASASEPSWPGASTTNALTMLVRSRS